MWTAEWPMPLKQPPGSSRMRRMIALIEQHRAALAALCRRFKVRRLDLFGSAAKGTFDPQSSDLDFLVSLDDMSPADYTDNYFGLAKRADHRHHQAGDEHRQHAVHQAIAEQRPGYDHPDARDHEQAVAVHQCLPANILPGSGTATCARGGRSSLEPPAVPAGSPRRACTPCR